MTRGTRQRVKLASPIRAHMEEGARQLLRQQKISEAEYASYIDQTLSLFQEFATKSGAIDCIGSGASCDIL